MTTPSAAALRAGLTEGLTDRSVDGDALIGSAGAIDADAETEV